MKKLIATAAASVLALATISAGEGLKVSGHIRGGLSDDISDSVADADYESPIGTTWVNGDHWGGASRGRLDVDYDGDNGGVNFRFTHELTSSDNFGMGNVDYAMAYAKFFEDMVIVEGGKLVDNYTAADDDNGAAFDGCMGVRLVIKPIEQLAITLQGSDYNPAYWHYDDSEKDNQKKVNRDGHAKFDASLFSLSARFENDTFAIAGGAHFSGVFYGSFLFKGIENLTLAAGFQADYAKHYADEWYYDYDENKWVEKDDIRYYKDRDYTDNLLIDANVEYDADPVLFGAIAYFYVADDAWFFTSGDGTMATINPYVQYKLSDIVALRAESTLFVPHDYDDKYGDIDRDMYCTITPSVVFNASEKADVNVWLQVSSDTDYTRHSTGVGVRYNF